MKTVLITGGNKGIGFQIAKELGQKGYFIILTARNTERGQQALNKLIKQGIQVAFIKMDVSSLQSIESAFEATKKLGRQIDILINNAGVLLDDNYPMLEAPSDIALTTFQINTLGPLWVIQTFLPLMQSGSQIINISSGAGSFCEGFSTWAPIYSASKTALNAITRQLHAVLSNKGIRINAMCPGWVRTDMGGSGASRSLEQGAETAVWLASSAPTTINGQFLRDKKVISW